MLIIMTTIIATLGQLSHAQMPDLVVQPLAPGIFAIRLDGDPASAFSIHRRVTGEYNFSKIADRKQGQAEYIDRCEVAPGESVTYQITVDGNVVDEEWTRNSAQLIAAGDFEDDSIAIEKLNGIALTASEPWCAALIDGGISPGKRCIEFSTTNPDVSATFSMTTHWYVVSPRSSYEFGWWSTSSLDGTSVGDGNGYAMTAERSKSYYEKTASLYVYPTNSFGNWVGYSAEPRLPRDARYAYIVVRGQGGRHLKPIQVDNLSIIDRDIELLARTDIGRLVTASRDASNAHADLNLDAHIEEQAGKIRDSLAHMNSVDNQSIDQFLAARADLCEAVRELNRLAVIFRLAEVK